ncbi:hypothetical protein JTE90_028037 [Oedothorax gibbosus]|uniref:Uncharacterized protein n=1 Tax=Oedothorax gibbosus TaxID=931172 RepID=A0AAV6TEV5_9ARAC|nr:hypothetical protein JTE90_028037 [Oedothorax gibbosus]
MGTARAPPGKFKPIIPLGFKGQRGKPGTPKRGKRCFYENSAPKPRDGADSGEHEPLQKKRKTFPGSPVTFRFRLLYRTWSRRPFSFFRGWGILTPFPLGPESEKKHERVGRFGQTSRFGRISPIPQDPLTPVQLLLQWNPFPASVSRVLT